MSLPLQEDVDQGVPRRQQDVYTYPACKSVKAVAVRVKAICRQDANMPLEVLLDELTPVLPSWVNYFRPGVSSAVFCYLCLRLGVGDQLIRRKHRQVKLEGTPPPLLRGGVWAAGGEVTLFNPRKVRTTCYRYRGAAVAFP